MNKKQVHKMSELKKSTESGLDKLINKINDPDVRGSGTVLTTADSIKRLVAQAVQEAQKDQLKKMRIKMNEVYSELESELPPQEINKYDIQFNDGFYRGRLNAAERITRKLFDIGGDILGDLENKDSIPNPNDSELNSKLDDLDNHLNKEGEINV